MTAKRINITIEEEMLEAIDSTANAYGMNRSECIAFLFEVLDEMNAWNVLENVAMENNDRPQFQPTKYQLMKAARTCHVERD